mmetsp:Transcript_95078/g.258037  ORF Transcript_95078/g.258037 Transcript_95078/m.258037 type:complete len:318 (-) Transcript_95078:539-1492(-)
MQHSAALRGCLSQKVRLLCRRLDGMVLQAARAGIALVQDLVPPDAGHGLQERPQGLALPPGHGAHLCAAVGSRLARDLQHLVRWQEAVRHAAVVGAPGALVVLAAQVHGHVAARARVPLDGGEPAAHRRNARRLHGLPAVRPQLGLVVRVPLFVGGGVDKALHHGVRNLLDINVTQRDPIQVLDEMVLLRASKICVVMNVIRIQEHLEGQQVIEEMRVWIGNSSFERGAPRLCTLQIVIRGYHHVACGRVREVQVRPCSSVVAEHAPRRGEHPDGRHARLLPGVLLDRQADRGEPADELLQGDGAEPAGPAAPLQHQ